MTTLTWNGNDLPEELRELPPGRYIITGVDGLTTLTREQEEGVRGAIAQADRGEVRDHEDVRAALKALVQK